MDVWGDYKDTPERGSEWLVEEHATTLQTRSPSRRRPTQPSCRAAPPSGRVAPCCPPRQTAGVRLCNHTLIGLADLRGSRPRVQVRGLSEGAQARSSACYQLARSSRLWETAIETASHSHSLACNTGHRPHLACTTSIGPELSHHPCSRLFSHVRSSLTHLDHQCRIGSSSGR